MTEAEIAELFIRAAEIEAKLPEVKGLREDYGRYTLPWVHDLADINGRGRIPGDRLDPLFRRIHGNTQHIGKVPERTGGQLKIRRELEQLKTLLQQYVMTEEFEKAAEIRDRIRALEKKMEQA